MNPVITAAEVACALGGSVAECLDSWQMGRSGLQSEGDLLVGRIADPRPSRGRRYGAASNWAVHVARSAVQQAGWTTEQTRQAWLFAASSRGNAGELLQHHGERRPVRRFSASNTLHSEIAAAVSIELGVRGPWQTLSNGCSSGLDALGMAWMALRAGLTQRVIVVAVDLPLVPELIRAFRDTHLLGTRGVNDPLSPQTCGLHLGEAAVAVTLEMADTGLAEMTRYAANSDAYDSLMIPEDGGPLAELLSGFDRPFLICPHATGTLNHALAEQPSLRHAFGEVPPLLMLKPFTGHTLGACGLLDVALISSALPRLPGNLPGLTGVSPGLIDVPPAAQILKIASGMGGHNAAVSLRALAGCGCWR